LNIYLDAVFYPKLDEMDFAQEGHRLEFSDPKDPATPLTYRGVVYNEMKGAMSAPATRLWHVLKHELYAHTTYRYNSGGEPDEIPGLSYAQLKDFHARHYHPSNAIFMTYGDFPVREHQTHFENCALREFQARRERVQIPDEPRRDKPQQHEAFYAYDEDEDLHDKTHIVLGWLLWPSTDVRELLRARLLEGVLLYNSASPLRQALETCPFASAPSELTGLDDSGREPVWICGVEGSNPEHAQAVEDHVFGVLKDVAKHGVDKAQLEAMLHQLELGQREVQGGLPYGLQLMSRALPAALHGSDPVAALDLDPLLNELRQETKNPGFIPGLVRRLLLDNPHRVRISMAPDLGMSARQAKLQARRLAKIEKSLSAEDRAAMVKRAALLQRRQAEEPNAEILPKIGRADIPATLRIPRGQKSAIGGRPLTTYARGTNGLVYQHVLLPLPAMTPEELDLLPLLTAFWAEVGCGRRGYVAMQARQASIGSVRVSLSIRGNVKNTNKIKGLLYIAGKGLVRKQRELADLLYTTLYAARFDELERLRELVAQTRLAAEASVTDQGHSLAMLAASAGSSPLAAWNERWDGLTSVRLLKDLDDSLESASRLKALGQDLADLHRHIVGAALEHLLVCEAEQVAKIREGLEAAWGKLPAAANASRLRLPFAPRTVRQAWAISTQVNFCAKAYATGIAPNHEDAPALSVLGHFLKNGFLHRTIREQGGAYGGGAGYDPDTGVFRFYSYRDPRLAETLADFDRSLDWLQGKHTEQQLEEAVLGVIGAIDHPDSPAGEAIKAFYAGVHGRTPAQRRGYRQRVLDLSLADVRRVARQYLRPQDASIAVLSDAGRLDASSALGLERQDL
jgi:hypothetical protein